MASECYIGYQDEVIAAEAQIDANCGFPNPCCQSWDIPTQAYGQEFWYIHAPPTSGYTDQAGTYYSQETMTAGVTNVDTVPFDPSWLPPSPITINK